MKWRTTTVVPSTNREQLKCFKDDIVMKAAVTHGPLESNLLPVLCQRPLLPIAPSYFFLLRMTNLHPQLLKIERSIRLKFSSFFNMVFKLNKPRLLLALYTADGADHPRYALLVTPKFKPSLHRNPGDKEDDPVPVTKYFVRKSRRNLQNELFKPWHFEKEEIADIDRDPGILVCTVVGKVLDAKKFPEAIASTPIYQLNNADQQKALDFDDRMWAKDAFQKLNREGIIAGMDWRTAEGGTNSFMRQKHTDDFWAVTIEGRNLPYVPIVDLLSGSVLRM